MSDFISPVLSPFFSIDLLTVDLQLSFLHVGRAGRGLRGETDGVKSPAERNRSHVGGIEDRRSALGRSGGSSSIFVSICGSLISDSRSSISARRYGLNECIRVRDRRSGCNGAERRPSRRPIGPPHRDSRVTAVGRRDWSAASASRGFRIFRQFQTASRQFGIGIASASLGRSAAAFPIRERIPRFPETRSGRDYRQVCHCRRNSAIS